MVFRRTVGITLVQLAVITALSMIALFILARQIRLEILEVSQSQKQSRLIRGWLEPVTQLREDLKQSVAVRLSRNFIELVQLELNAESPPVAQKIRYELFPDQCLLGRETPEPCFGLKVISADGTRYYRKIREVHWCIHSGEQTGCPSLPLPGLRPGQRVFVAEWTFLGDGESTEFTIPMAVTLPPEFSPRQTLPLRSRRPS